MLGFITAGLKLIGKILAKAVVAVVAGSAVACTVSHWEDFIDAGGEAVIKTSDAIDEKKKEYKNRKPTWKEAIILLVLWVKWSAAVAYALIMICLAYTSAVIDGVIECIFKTLITKEAQHGRYYRS